MLAREDFCRGHQCRLKTVGGRIGHGQSRDGGLARADIALQQPPHLFAGSQVAADFGERLGLGPGQVERQGRQKSGRGVARLNTGRGRDLARAATAGQGQLVGQQFVEGQPLPGRGVRLQVRQGRRRMHGLYSAVPVWPAAGGDPGGVLPLGQLRRGGQGLECQLADLTRGDPGRGGIDRFDGGDVLPLVQRHDPVRMDDLDLVVEPLDLAGHQPPFTARKLSVDMLGAAPKPDQVDEAGLVRGAHLQRRTDLARCHHAVDDDVEHPDLAFNGVDGGRATPRDQSVGRQEQQVAHQRPGQFMNQGCDLGPHALQAGDLREQGKENLRPHDVQHSWRRRRWNAI